MPANPQLLYWDSCVFLSYIDAEKDRVDTLETILDEVHKSGGAKKIVTSTVSIVEVAFGAQEKDKRRIISCHTTENRCALERCLSTVIYRVSRGYCTYCTQPHARCIT